MGDRNHVAPLLRLSVTRKRRRNCLPVLRSGMCSTPSSVW